MSKNSSPTQLFQFKTLRGQSLSWSLHCRARTPTLSHTEAGMETCQLTSPAHFGDVGKHQSTWRKATQMWGESANSAQTVALAWN